MKKISEIYNVEIANDEYVNSDNFNIEKSLDDARYTMRFATLFDNLRYDYNEYVTTDLSIIENANKYIKNDKFKQKYAKFIKDNILKVDVVVTKKNKTTKTFSDYKMTDFLIEFCYMFHNLNLYQKCLLAYKEKHNDMVANLPVKDVLQMNDLNLALVMNKYAFDLLKENPNDKKLHVVGKTWLKFLENHINIGTYSMEYVGKYYEVDSMLPFTPEERKQIVQTYNTVNSVYNTKNKGDKANENVL